MLKIVMGEERKDEKRIRQEDCAEDLLGTGILTLTTKRIVFDKSRGRIMDFTKKFENTVLDVPLTEIVEVWREGMFMKKVCFTTTGASTIIKKKDPDDPQDKEKQDKTTYKFGVFSIGGWVKDLTREVEKQKEHSSS